MTGASRVSLFESARRVFVPKAIHSLYKGSQRGRFARQERNLLKKTSTVFENHALLGAPHLTVKVTCFRFRFTAISTLKWDSPIPSYDISHPFHNASQQSVPCFLQLSGKRIISNSALETCEDKVHSLQVWPWSTRFSFWARHIPFFLAVRCIIVQQFGFCRRDVRQAIIRRGSWD